jgi:hypothetical protein
LLLWGLITIGIRTEESPAMRKWMVLAIRTAIIAANSGKYEGREVPSY